MPEPSAPITIPLDRPAIHVEVRPGGEIVLKGSFHSTFDGSTIDAATTTWPKDAPGGASVDAGGIIDFEAGGFHMTSRDPVTHEVHAIATGEEGAACALSGVASPCLPIRIQKQAVSRLITVGDWKQSLKGNINVTLMEAPAYAPPPAAVPYVKAAGAALALGLVVAVGVRWWKKRAASPEGQLLALARRVREKAKRTDQVLAAPLVPALENALKALQNKRVDASSAEGKRVAAVLVRVEAKLDQTAQETKAEEEQRAADELQHEIDAALEAADAVTNMGRPPK